MGMTVRILLLILQYHYLYYSSAPCHGGIIGLAGHKHTDTPMGRWVYGTNQPAGRFAGQINSSVGLLNKPMGWYNIAMLDKPCVGILALLGEAMGPYHGFPGQSKAMAR